MVRRRGGLRLARAGGAGEAEVGDLDPAVDVEEHVVGLGVAADEAGVVGRREAAPGRLEHREDLAPGASPVAHRRAQGHAARERHGDEELALVRADAVDRDHAGVRQLGLGLAQAGAATSSAADQLDRHLALELGIEGGVDDAHTAGADPLEDEVAAAALGLGVGIGGRPGPGVGLQQGAVGAVAGQVASGERAPDLGRRARLGRQGRCRAGRRAVLPARTMASGPARAR
nr:hypothetical protein [Nannocystis exedens]